MKDFWPIDVDMEHDMPIETLLEECNLGQTKLEEIKFDIQDAPIVDKGTYQETELNTPEGYYRVHFKHINNKVYEMTFRVDLNKPNISNLKQYLDNFDKGLKSTNKRDPFKIFSFVISSALSFIKKYDVAALHITANERKKNRTYQMLINNIANQIGWQVKDGKSDDFYEAFIINQKLLKQE